MCYSRGPKSRGTLGGKDIGREDFRRGREKEPGKAKKMKGRMEIGESEERNEEGGDD